MLECRDELSGFLHAMSVLEDRLGPLLLQFPYFNKKNFPNPEDFFARLVPFLEQLPSGFQYALEVRNKYFVNSQLLEILHKKNIALALIDHPWMTPIAQLASKFDLVTADFTYPTTCTSWAP